MIRTATATLCLLASVAAAAQTSSPGADPLSKAKTAGYLERFADEVRAKEGMEKARTALKTRKFREALAGAGTLNATAGRFFTAGGTAFVAVQVGVPSGAAKAGTSLTLFGEVLDKDGRSLADFEVRSPVLESKGDLYVEHSLLASDAATVARVGVAKGDQVLGVAQHTLSVEAAANPPAGELSQLIVSNDIFNMARKQSPFEPFAFGGTKVIPKPDRAFRPHDEAWLFVELRDQNEAAPLPTLSIRATIEGMGRTIAGTWQAAEVSPLKGVGGHFGIGTTVDLSSLKPGDYRVTLAVRDTNAKQTFERAQTIIVRE